MTERELACSPSAAENENAVHKPVFRLFRRITIGDIAALCTIASLLAAGGSYLVTIHVELATYRNAKIATKEKLEVNNERAKQHITYALRIEHSGPSNHRKQFNNAKEQGADNWISAIWASRDNPDATRTICTLGQDETRKYVAEILSSGVPQ